jgi:hypothetical protein
MTKRFFLPFLLLWASAAAAQNDAYSVVGIDQLFRVPLFEGSPVEVGTLPVTSIFGLAFDGAGTLYGVSADTDELLVIDPDTAQVTSVGPLGFDVSIQGGLTFDPAGDLWLVSDNDLYSVDAQDGQATLFGDLASSVDVWGLSACGDQLTALYNGPGGEKGLASIDTATVTLEISSEHNPLGTHPPAGVDWFQGQVFSLENRVSVITPPPMTEGSFLIRLTDMGVFLDERWLMYPLSLAFAIGPPPSVCRPLAPVDVPALSPAGVLALAGLLAFCAVAVISRRRLASVRG